MSLEPLSGEDESLDTLVDGRTDIESRAVVSSVLGAARQAISAMDGAVQ